MSDRWFQLSQLLVAKKNGRETCKRHLGPVSNAARRPTPSRSTASWVSVKRKMVKTSSTIKLINKINSDLKIGIFVKKNIWHFRQIPSSFIKYLVSGTKQGLYFSHTFLLYFAHMFIHGFSVNPTSFNFNLGMNKWKKKKGLICFYFIKDQ